MASHDDIIEVFDYFRDAGIKKAPRADDVGKQIAYQDALENVSTEILWLAVKQWCRDADQGLWMPAAPQLLGLALDIEAHVRTEHRDTARGCVSCGEVLAEDGTVSTHGTGFRTLIQRRFPTVDGEVDWHADPIRVGEVAVLCTCDKGRRIAAQHQLAMQVKPEKGKRSSRPADWKPTMTAEEAWHKFTRPHDVRCYLTGSKARANSRDADPRSPFHSRPSPEERLIDGAQAARERWVAEEVSAGRIDPARHVSKLMSRMGR